MRKVLGIILAVLECIAAFAVFVWLGSSYGLDLVDSIITTLIGILICAVIAGMVILTMWLLEG